MTVVFCDVAGSTELGEGGDPETVRAVIGRYFETMREALEAHGGAVEKFIGDAVMARRVGCALVAVFGIPQVREDDALRAVRAAWEMRGRMRALNDELERDWRVRIDVRTGVNTGEVVAGDPSQRQTFATGEAVNTAARLEAAAPAGAVLLGPVTYRLVRDAASHRVLAAPEAESSQPAGADTSR